jgi:hypothetical protein
MRNDLISLKMLLDIYEDYSKNNNLELYKEVINTILLFYYSIKDIDVEIIYIAFKDRSIAKIEKERVLFRTRREYIRYYRTELLNIERLNSNMKNII